MLKINEIKIIDLVNQIARQDPDLPIKVKYGNHIYKWDRGIGDYRKNGYGECLLIKEIFGTFDCCGRHNSFYNMLWDTAEKTNEEE